MPLKYISQWSFGFALAVNGSYMTPEFTSSGTAKVVHAADVTALSKVIFHFQSFQTFNNHISLQLNLESHSELGLFTVDLFGVAP